MNFAFTYQFYVYLPWNARDCKTSRNLREPSFAALNLTNTAPVTALGHDKIWAEEGSRSYNITYYHEIKGVNEILRCLNSCLW